PFTVADELEGDKVKAVLQEEPDFRHFPMKIRINVFGTDQLEQAARVNLAEEKEKAKKEVESGDRSALCEKLVLLSHEAIQFLGSSIDFGELDVDRAGNILSINDILKEQLARSTWGPLSRIGKRELAHRKWLAIRMRGILEYIAAYPSEFDTASRGHLFGASVVSDVILDELSRRAREREGVVRKTEKRLIESGADLNERIETGDMLEDRYKILSKIGAGGMGSVYWAYDTKTQRTVALKTLNIEGDISLKAKARLTHEAGMMFRMEHEGVMPFLDYDHTHKTKFYTMELVNGVLLREYFAEQKKKAKKKIEEKKEKKQKITKKDKFDEETFALLFQRATKALIHARKKNIIHRDIKASNIMVRRGRPGDPMPVVMDLGIGKLTEEADEKQTSLTDAGEKIGTPEYKSPEMALDEFLGYELDKKKKAALEKKFGFLEKKKLSAEDKYKTDVYSLGVVMYEMATGKSPFGKKIGPELTKARFYYENITPPRKVKSDRGEQDNSAISRSLEAVIMRCLKVDPRERYTAEELLKELQRIREGKLSREYIRNLGKRTFLVSTAGLLGGLIVHQVYPELWRYVFDTFFEFYGFPGLIANAVSYFFVASVAIYLAVVAVLAVKKAAKEKSLFSGNAVIAAGSGEALAKFISEALEFLQADPYRTAAIGAGVLAGIVVFALLVRKVYYCFAKTKRFLKMADNKNPAKRAAGIKGLLDIAERALSEGNDVDPKIRAMFIKVFKDRRNNEDARALAARGIGMMGSEMSGMIDALVECVTDETEDEEVQEEAAIAVSEIGGKGPHDVVDSLKDEYWKVRMLAARAAPKALAKAKPEAPHREEAIGLLDELLTDAENSQVREAAMDALEAFGGLTHGSKTKKYDADLKDESASIRNFAFRVLDELGALTVERKLKKYRADLEYGDAEMRKNTVKDLGAMRDQAKRTIEDIFAGMINDPEPDVQEAVITELGKFDTPSRRTVVQVMEKADNGPENVRKAAAQALGTMAHINKAAMEKLIKMLEDDSDQVSGTAMTTIAGTGSLAVPYLIDVLKREGTSKKKESAQKEEPEQEYIVPEDVVRRLAEKKIGMFKSLPKGLSPRREKLVRDFDLITPKARMNAAKTLGLTGEKAVPSLMGLLEENGLEDHVYEAAVYALVKADAPAIPELIKGLLSKNYRVTLYSTKALEKIGPRGILALVEKLDDEDLETRIAAAKALEEIAPREEVVMERLKKASTGDDYRVRTSAERALKRIEAVTPEKIAHYRKIARTEKDITDAIYEAEEPVFGVDTGGNVTIWNRAMEALTGHSCDEIVGFKLLKEKKVVREEDFSDIFPEKKNAAEPEFEVPPETWIGCKTHEVEIDGVKFKVDVKANQGQCATYLRFHGKAGILSEGVSKVHFVWGVPDDPEKAAKAAGEELRRAFLRTLHGLWLTLVRKGYISAEGEVKDKLIAMTPEFRHHMKGCSEKEMRVICAILQNPDDIIRNDYQSTFETVFDDAVQGKEDKSYKLLIHTKGGAQISFIFRTVIRTDAESVITGFINVGQDVTEIEREVNEKHLVDENSDLARVIGQTVLEARGLMTEEFALRKLLADLKDENSHYRRRKAAMALKEQGLLSEEIVPDLLEALAVKEKMPRDKKKKDPRINILAALERMGGRANAAMQAVEGLMSDSSNGYVQKAAEKAFVAMGGTLTSKHHETTMIANLRSEDDQVSDSSQKLLEALGKFTPERQAEKLIRDMSHGTEELDYSSEKSKKRWEAALALGHLGPVTDEVIPALIDAACKGYDQKVKEAAVDALSKIYIKYRLEGKDGEKDCLSLASEVARKEDAVRGRFYRTIRQKVELLLDDKTGKLSPEVESKFHMADLRDNSISRERSEAAAVILGKIAVGTIKEDNFNALQEIINALRKIEEDESDGFRQQLASKSLAQIDRAMAGTENIDIPDKNEGPDKPGGGPAAGGAGKALTLIIGAGVGLSIAGSAFGQEAPVLGNAAPAQGILAMSNLSAILLTSLALVVASALLSYLVLKYYFPEKWARISLKLQYYRQIRREWVRRKVKNFCIAMTFAAEPSMRSYFLNVISRIGAGRDVVNILISRLKDRDSAVVKVAVKNLGKLGVLLDPGSNLRDDIINALRESTQDKDHSVRIAALGELHNLIKEKPNWLTIEMMKETMAKTVMDDSSEVRKAGRSMLRALGSEREVSLVHVLNEALENSNAGVREDAALFLRTVDNNEQSLGPLVKRLSDPDLSVRRAAAYTLSNVIPKTKGALTQTIVRRKLFEALNDKDEKFCAIVIGILGDHYAALEDSEKNAEVKDDITVVFVKCLYRPERGVVKAVTEALKKIAPGNEKAAALLTAACGSDSIRARNAAEEILQSTNEKEEEKGAGKESGETGRDEGSQKEGGDWLGRMIVALIAGTLYGVSALAMDNAARIDPVLLAWGTGFTVLAVSAVMVIAAGSSVLVLKYSYPEKWEAIKGKIKTKWENYKSDVKTWWAFPRNIKFWLFMSNASFRPIKIKAIEALGKTASTHDWILDSLIGCVSYHDPLVRRAALNSLGELKKNTDDVSAGDKIDDAILKALHDANSGVAFTAWAQLRETKAPTEAVLETLEETLEGGGRSVRKATAQILNYVDKSKKAVTLLLGCLSDPVSSVRHLARKALRDLKVPQEIIINQGLVQALKSDNKRVRRFAVLWVNQIDKNIHAVNELINCLTFDDPHVRYIAAKTLDEHSHKIEGDFAFKELCSARMCEAMSDPDPEIRRYIVRALGAVGHTISAPYLLIALKDEAAIRQAAIEALGKMYWNKKDDSTAKKKIVPEVIDHGVTYGTDKKEAEGAEQKAVAAKVRLAAVNFLCRFGAGIEKAEQALVGRLFDENEDVREMAEKGLSKFGDEKAIDVLSVCANAANAQDREIAARVLGKIAKRFGRESIKGRGIEKILTKLMEDPDENVCGAARLSLYGLGLSNEEFMIIYAGHLKSKDINVRKYAADNLARYAAHPKEPSLEKMSETKKMTMMLTGEVSPEDEYCLSDTTPVSVRREQIMHKLIPALIEALNDEDKKVRYLAAMALSHMHNEKAKSYSNLYFGHVDERVLEIDRFIKVIATKRMQMAGRGQQLPEEFENYRPSYPETPASRVDLLFEALSSGVEVRLGAVRSLGDIIYSLNAGLRGEEEPQKQRFIRPGRSSKPIEVSDLPLREEIYEKLDECLKDDDGAVRGYALHLLQDQEDPELVGSLLTGLGDPYPENRISAVTGLHRLYSRYPEVREKSLQAIMFAAGEETPGVRQEAVRALIDIGTTQVVPTLVKALNDDQEDIRRMAAEGLEKIGKDTDDLEARIYSSLYKNDINWIELSVIKNDIVPQLKACLYNEDLSAIVGGIKGLTATGIAMANDISGLDKPEYRSHWRIIFKDIYAALQRIAAPTQPEWLEDEVQGAYTRAMQEWDILFKRFPNVKLAIMPSMEEEPEEELERIPVDIIMKANESGPETCSGASKALSGILKALKVIPGKSGDLLQLRDELVGEVVNVFKFTYADYDLRKNVSQRLGEIQRAWLAELYHYLFTGNAEKITEVIMKRRDWEVEALIVALDYCPEIRKTAMEALGLCVLRLKSDPGRIKRILDTAMNSFENDDDNNVRLASIRTMGRALFALKEAIEHDEHLKNKAGLIASLFDSYSADGRRDKDFRAAAAFAAGHICYALGEDTPQATKITLDLIDVLEKEKDIQYQKFVEENKMTLEERANVVELDPSTATIDRIERAEKRMEKKENTERREIRRSIVQGLGYTMSPETVPVLARVFVREKDSDIRIEAIRSLGRIASYKGDDREIVNQIFKLLKKAMKDKEGRIRFTAAQSMGALLAGIGEELKTEKSSVTGYMAGKMLQSPERVIRAEAGKALPKGDPRTLQKYYNEKRAGKRLTKKLKKDLGGGDAKGCLETLFELDRYSEPTAIPGIEEFREEWDRFVWSPAKDVMDKADEIKKILKKEEDSLQRTFDSVMEGEDEDLLVAVEYLFRLADRTDIPCLKRFKKEWEVRLPELKEKLSEMTIHLQSRIQDVQYVFDQMKDALSEIKSGVEDADEDEVYGAIEKLAKMSDDLGIPHLRGVLDKWESVLKDSVKSVMREMNSDLSNKSRKDPSEIFRRIMEDVFREIPKVVIERTKNDPNYLKWVVAFEIVEREEKLGEQTGRVYDDLTSSAAGGKKWGELVKLGRSAIPAIDKQFREQGYDIGPNLENAAGALRDINDKSAIPVLIREFPYGRKTDLGRVAVVDAVSDLADKDDKNVIKFFKSAMLTDPGLHIRASAAGALLRMDSAAELEPLFGPDHRKILEAYEKMGHAFYGKKTEQGELELEIIEANWQEFLSLGKEITPALIAGLKDNADIVKKSCANALGDMEAREAAGDLAEVLIKEARGLGKEYVYLPLGPNYARLDKVEQALVALDKLGSVEAIKPLSEALPFIVCPDEDPPKEENQVFDPEKTGPEAEEAKRRTFELTESVEETAKIYAELILEGKNTDEAKAAYDEAVKKASRELRGLNKKWNFAAQKIDAAENRARFFVEMGQWKFRVRKLRTLAITAMAKLCYSLIEERKKSGEKPVGRFAHFLYSAGGRLEKIPVKKISNKLEKNAKWKAKCVFALKWSLNMFVRLWNRFAESARAIGKKLKYEPLINATDALINALSLDDEEVRMTVLKLLPYAADTQEQGAKDQVRALLSCPHADVRRSIAKHMAGYEKIFEEDSPVRKLLIRALLGLLSDPDRELRGIAGQSAKALGATDEEIVEAFIKALESPDYNARLEAIDYLDTVSAGSALKPLAKFLFDEDRALRLAAFKAITNLDTYTDLIALEFIKALKTPYADTRSGAIEALGTEQLHDERAVMPLT
ncbi:MAG: HEAT repeat domain-containing protein, partial [Candidatus Omnitrophota bacterium]